MQQENGGSQKDHNRLAALGRSDAVRADWDEVLQELVDDVRDIFGADLCVVHLMLTDSLYFRAWSGPLPKNFVESREIAAEQSMCPNVVESASPLIVEDLLATERFRDHFVCAVGGLRFYAGTPLVTSKGEVIGTLCLLGVKPRPFGEGEMTTLSAFARAVVGRLELIGALKREQISREEEARHSRELRRVLDQSLDIITTIGFDGEIKALNRACAPVLGYEPEELLGRRYMELVHPGDHPRAIEAAKRLYRGQTVALLQNRYLHKDGDVVWIEWSATPAPGESVYHCVARDITARKLAEEELRRSEDRLNLAVSSARLGTFDFDLQAGKLIWDERCKEVFGLPPDAEVDYATFLAGLHPEDRGRADRAVKRAMDPAGGGFEMEFRTAGIRDGAERWVVARGQAFFDAEGGAVRLVGTVLDVTEEKRVEEDLRRQRDLYEGLLDAQSAVGEAFVVLEGERITYANEAIARISGYGVTELLGLPSLFDLIPPEHRDGARERMRQRLVGQTAEELIETTVLHKSGRRVELEAGVRMLRRNGLARFVLVARDITGRKRAERAQRESEERFRQLFEQSVDALLVHDAEGRILDCNSEACRSLGYTREEFLSLCIQDVATDVLSEEERRARGDDTLWRRTVAGEPGEVTSLLRCEHRRKDGSTFPVEVKLGAIDYGGRRVIFNSARDVTERERAEEERRRAEEKYRSIFENAVEGIYQTSLDGRFVTANPAMARIFGYGSPEELINSVESIERQLFWDPERRNELVRLLGEHGSVYDFVSRGVRKDGKVIWVSANTHVLYGADGEVLGFEGTLEDITERKELEEQLHHQAFHDALTGLPNRLLFSDRLGQALARAERRENLVAVLFMDLDNFKHVNDSLGHEAGDRLLVGVAERLRACLRPEDTAARLGGDEFTVLLEDVADASDAARVAGRIIEDLRVPFEVGGHEVLTAASIGIALDDRSRDRPADLMREADLAMYWAKSKGRARYEVFEGPADARTLDPPASGLRPTKTP